MIGLRLAFSITLLLGSGLFNPVAAEAQQAAKIARIGYLGENPATSLSRFETVLTLSSSQSGP